MYALSEGFGAYSEGRNGGEDLLRVVIRGRAGILSPCKYHALKKTYTSHTLHLSTGYTHR